MQPFHHPDIDDVVYVFCLSHQFEGLQKIMQRDFSGFRLDPNKINESYKEKQTRILRYKQRKLQKSKTPMKKTKMFQKLDLGKKGSLQLRKMKNEIKDLKKIN